MLASSTTIGKVFDIQGFSLHDGPGCRTLLFLKGCSLHCFWCSNPEGILKQNVPMYYGTKCQGCGNCFEACHLQAIKLEDKQIRIERDQCLDCATMECSLVCNNGALRSCERLMTVDEAFTIIQRDQAYWGDKGGITLSGGEPLLQVSFVRELLTKCYDSYIHTAIETCGNVPWQSFEAVIPFLDWIFYDLKHPDALVHQAATGASNEQIISNIQKLDAHFTGDLIFRLPLIPGFNDSVQDLTAFASIVNQTQWKTINLLPLHHYGREKYAALGLNYHGSSYQSPTPEQLSKAKKIMKDSGIDCFIGAGTPF